MSDKEILMFFLGGLLTLIGVMIVLYVAAAGHWLARALRHRAPLNRKPHYLHLLR